MRSVLALCFALACLVSSAVAQAPDSTQPPWRSFQGSWSASGQRQSLPTESPRAASTVYLSGALVLSGEGVGKGFRGEVIGFDDGTGASVGRCVWTDERGDRIFSAMTGGPIGTGRHITGTITGGTGRYAGITGEYALDWQYVVEADGGTIQGRAVGLKGRFRVDGAGR